MQAVVVGGIAAACARPRAAMYLVGNHCNAVAVTSHSSIRGFPTPCERSGRRTPEVVSTGAAKAVSPGAVY